MDTQTLKTDDNLTPQDLEETKPPEIRPAVVVARKGYWTPEAINDYVMQLQLASKQG